MDQIIFDKSKYRRLKREYQKAVDSKLEAFTFDGRELVTSYAKYLLEFLKSKFE